MSKNNLSSIPYYCKFIAIINKYVKDIHINIVEELKKFTEKMIKEKLPETINKKMKCVRFICELSKFHLLDLVYILEFINLLIENFTSDNAELCHYVFDNCALLLLSTSKTHIRFLNILKRFKKIKNSKNLTSQVEMLFDECYLKINNFITKNTVRTAQGGNKKKVSKYTEAELQKKYFLKKLLFSDILTKDAEVICKYIRKFDWEDKFVERCLKKYVFQYLMYMSFFQINYIASLLFHLAKYKPFFVTQVIDELYERILIVLENYEHEKFPFLIQYVRLFAELYNYKILSSENVFDMLYFFIAIADLDICNSHHISSIYKLFHENIRFFTNGRRNLVNGNTLVHGKRGEKNDDDDNDDDDNDDHVVEKKEVKTQMSDMNETEEKVNGNYEAGSLNKVKQKKELKETETGKEKERERSTNINSFVCLKKRTGIGTGVEERSGTAVGSGRREGTSVKIDDITMEMEYEDEREKENDGEDNFFFYNEKWGEKCINYLFINQRNPIIGHILNETQRFSFINVKLICIIIENSAKYLRKQSLIFKFKKFFLFFMRFLLVLGTLPLHIYDMVEKVVQDNFEELLMLKTVNSVDIYLLRMLNAEYKLYLNEIGRGRIGTVTESDLEAPLEELKKMYTLHIEELNKKKEEQMGKGKKCKSRNEFERIVLPEKKEDELINADDTGRANEVEVGMYSAKEETDIDVYCRETQIYREGCINTNNNNNNNNNNNKVNNNNNVVMNSIYRNREDLMQEGSRTKLQASQENHNINDSDHVDVDMDVDLDVDDDYDDDDDDDITDGYVNTTLSKSVLMEADELDKEINAMINESLKERRSNLTNDIESFRFAFMAKNENNEGKKTNMERGKVRILLKKNETADEIKCRNGERDDVSASKKNVKIKKGGEQKGSGFVTGSGAGVGTLHKGKTEEEEKDDAYIKSFVLNRAENIMEEDRRKEELRLKKMLYKNSLKYADYEDDLDDFYA